MYNSKQIIIGRILQATAFLMSLVWSTGVPDKQRQGVVYSYGYGSGESTI
jgi:hypothetical protein